MIRYFETGNITYIFQIRRWFIGLDESRKRGLNSRRYIDVMTLNVQDTILPCPWAAHITDITVIELRDHLLHKLDYDCNETRLISSLRPRNP